MGVSVFHDIVIISLFLSKYNSSPAANLKIDLDFCLSDLYFYPYGFQSHHPLRLFLLHVNYIKLQGIDN